MSKLLGFEYTVQWITGKNHKIANALSRKPVFVADKHDDIIIWKVSEMVLDLALHNAIKHAEEDEDYQKVVDALKWGIHAKKLHEAHPAQKYRSLWEEMAVYEGDRLLTRNNPIIVPTAARKAILASIHIQQMGQTKTLDSYTSGKVW